MQKISMNQRTKGTIKKNAGRKIYSGHRGRNRRRRPLKIALFILLPLLAVLGGALLFLKMHPLFLKQEVVEQELKEDFHPMQNIGFVFGGKLSQVSVEGNVDTTKAGDYTLTYHFNDYEKKAVVKVRDTKPPKLTVRSYTTDLQEEIRPEQFVESVEDASEVSIKFENPQAWDQPDTYEVEIAAVDASGNETVEKASLTRVKDETGPKISGAGDVEILQGKTFDFQDGVNCSDDMDPAPVLEVNTDQVNLNTPGTYKAVYTAKDRSGNVTTVERKITVDRNEEYDQKIVYLTFDDGPSENTGKILDILDRYGIKATFFVTGNNQKYDYMITRAHDEGHSIGLHTYTHDYADVYASEDAYFKDLQKISDLVENLTGEKSHIIRFPGGSSNTKSAKFVPGLMTSLVQKVQEKGYQYFDWNCDSTDASGNNVAVEKLVANATSSSKQHINILMHDTDAKDTTVEALPQIIEHYRDKGYTFKAITKDSFAPHHKVNN